MNTRGLSILEYNREIDRLEQDADSLRNTITSMQLSMREQQAELERLKAQNKRLMSRGIEDMHDEIERLREEQKAMLVTMRDRAVEIERLRLERDEHRQSALNAIHGYKQLQARIAKLEGALKEICKMGSNTNDWPPEVGMRKIARAALAPAEADNER